MKPYWIACIPDGFKRYYRVTEDQGLKNGLSDSMMAETGEVYRCEVCGMVVEVKEAGGGELVCCDQPMVKEN